MIPRSESRLTTQNLVISACVATDHRTVDWPAIHDLSTLIDLYCMYDSVTVLGRPESHILPFELTRLLLSDGFLKIDSPDDDLAEEVSAAARSHLRSFCGDDEDPAIEHLLRIALAPTGMNYGLRAQPDRSHEVAEGEVWLKAGPSRSQLLKRLRREKGVARSTTFVVRSFVYLGYSDVTGYVFVPDAVREPVLGAVAATEGELRSKLLKTISRSAAARMTANVKALSRVSPLAAVVFERSKPDRKRIVRELKALREELTSLRERLGSAERKIFYGVGAEPVEALNEWKRVNRELKRRFGDEPHLVSLEQVFSFGKSGAKAIDDPLKPGSWLELLIGMPYTVAKRTILRRKAVELHRLHREIPAAGRLYESINALFGSRIAE
jgi:hypothetical protein